MAALNLKLIRLYTLALGVALALAPPTLAADVSVQLDAGAGFSVKNSTGATERLRVDEATGNVSRNGALFVHTTGTNNTFVGVSAGNTSTTGDSNSAFGVSALQANTTGGQNSAVGSEALRFNTTGFANSAVGNLALRSNTLGEFNSAVGVGALRSNTTGGFNSAVGNGALRFNTLGDLNSAVGVNALYDNSTGSRNVAVGFEAGQNQTIGSDNIYLANDGVAAESGKIKIGNTAHTETFIEGIDGNTATGGVAVLINSSNELHTIVSSARFKQDVRDMRDTSDLLMKLRPVTFRYREETVGAEEPQVEQYGLIAEEVAEVAPELVARDLEGRPYSVMYHILPALLVNEAQKQERANLEQQRTIERQQQVIAELSSRLALLEGKAGAAAASEGATQ